MPFVEVPLELIRLGGSSASVSGTERQTTMSYFNQLERDQVCLCPKELSYLGEFGGMVSPRYHEDDCPLFSDYSTGEREGAEEYVF